MTYEKLWNRLCTVYDSGEAKAIVRMVLDERFGLSAADVYCGKVTQLSSDEQAELKKIMLRLEQAEPVHYVLGWANFCNRQFSVAPGVLIPRPETEELCSWITEDVGNRQQPAILDIGTGSGCIAISLALDIKGSAVSAWDISTDALRIAKENAARLCADINIMKQDALTPPQDANRWDVIVSNPPYICEKEKTEMERNVLDNEPAIALFVPDNDPLLFYRAIALYGTKALKPKGMLFFEINAAYAAETCNMLKQLGYVDVEARNDLFGKARMVRACMG